MIARFDLQKDHRTLLEAVASVSEAHVDLVGDGPLLPAVRQLAVELGIDDRVRFLGHRSDVAAGAGRSPRLRLDLELGRISSLDLGGDAGRVADDRLRCRRQRRGGRGGRERFYGAAWRRRDRDG
jgi:glycosyltransferase involved in cell wall biosynthesis